MKSRNSRSIPGIVPDFDTIIYPAVARWMTEEGITFRDLAQAAFGVPEYGAKAWRWLHNHGMIRMPLIIAILRMSGMTFEQAFGEVR